MKLKRSDLRKLITEVIEQINEGDPFDELESEIDTAGQNVNSSREQAINFLEELKKDSDKLKELMTQFKVLRHAKGKFPDGSSGSRVTFEDGVTHTVKDSEVK